MSDQQQQQTQDQIVNVGQQVNISLIVAALLDAQSLIRQVPGLVAEVQRLHAELDALKAAAN